MHLSRIALWAVVVAAGVYAIVLFGALLVMGAQVGPIAFLPLLLGAPFIYILGRLILDRAKHDSYDDIER